MSNTPESDEAVRVYANEGAQAHRVFIAYVDPGFARTLETQRDEARAEVERLRKAINEVLPGMKCQQPPKLGAWNWPWAVETLEAALQPEIIGWKPATASHEIFEAHGLEWYRHTPGDECPCDLKQWVKCLTSKEGETATSTAVVFGWKVKRETDYQWGLIIGWRPADAPEKLAR